MRQKHFAALPRTSRHRIVIIPAPFSPSPSTFQDYRAVSLFRQDSPFERCRAFGPIHIVQIREIVRLSVLRAQRLIPQEAPEDDGDPDDGRAKTAESISARTRRALGDVRVSWTSCIIREMSWRREGWS